MEKIKLNKEVCAEHLDVLEEANQQWFNGWNIETEDYLRLVKAVQYFEKVKVQQREKLIKEGKL